VIVCRQKWRDADVYIPRLMLVLTTCRLLNVEAGIISYRVFMLRIECLDWVVYDVEWRLCRLVVALSWIDDEMPEMLAA